MTRKVLFAGQCFRDKEQRGIYLFAKALIHAVKSKGFETGILSNASHNGPCEALTASIFKEFDNPVHASGPISKVKWLRKYIERRFLGRPRAALVENPRDIVVEEAIRYLDDVDFFYNIPDGYRLMAVHDRLPLLRRPFPLHLPAELDGGVFFTTSPMSVESRGKKIKIVQTLHDLIPLSASMHREDPGLFYKRLKALNDHSDAILAVSEYSRNQLLKFFPSAADRVKVVYQPVPADKYLIGLSALPVVQQSVLEKFGLLAGQYCFYVGAIEARKNIDRLVSAYTIAAKGLDVPLVLGGIVDQEYVRDRHLEQYFAKRNSGEDAGRPQRRDSVRYVGYITELEKLCLIRNARALLFPSLNEGFGIPPLEAQTFGCPVLTSNVASLPEVVADSAYLIDDPYNIEEIATGIRKLLDDDDLCDTLRRAGYRNAARFSEHNFAEQVSALIDSV